MASPSRAPIRITFKGLLVLHLWNEFPQDSSDEVNARAMRLIKTCSPASDKEQAAWRLALADRARDRGF